MNKSRKFALLKARLKRKYLKGSVHRGLLIRSKVNFQRIKGVYLKFGENAVVLITRMLFLFLIKFMVQFYVNVYALTFFGLCFELYYLICMYNKIDFFFHYKYILDIFYLKNFF